MTKPYFEDVKSSINFRSEGGFSQLDIIGNSGVGDYISFSVTGDELRVVASNGTVVYFDEIFTDRKKNDALNAFAEIGKLKDKGEFGKERIEANIDSERYEGFNRQGS